MNTSSVNYYATLQERADCTVVSFFYPSRRRPLQEVYYSFEDGLDCVERKHYELYDYNEFSKVWSFVKAAKPRTSKQAKARAALQAHIKRLQDEIPF